jgi:hypothetical protein
MVVEVLGTELTNLFWQVFCLRDHLWHRRDLRQHAVHDPLPARSGGQGTKAGVLKPPAGGRPPMMSLLYRSFAFNYHILLPKSTIWSEGWLRTVPDTC